MGRKRNEDRKAGLAVGYCRVSTSEQERDGVSLDVQEARLREYAARIGLELLAVIRDQVSGTVPFDARPGGGEVLRLLEEHRAGSVIALAHDRIARDQVDGTRRVREWGRLGVTVHLPQDGGPVDNVTAAGRASTGMRTVMAAWWRDVIAERTREALAHKRSRGEAVGRPPAGFRIVRDEFDPRVTRLAPEPGHPALETRRRVRELRGAGLSLAAVADRLNGEGFVPARGGQRFYGSTVARMLSSTAELAHV